MSVDILRAVRCGIEFPRSYVSTPIPRSENDKDQVEVLRLFERLWEQKAGFLMHEVLEKIDVYFDPEKTPSLMSFIAYGGLEFVVRALEDSGASWVCRINALTSGTEFFGLLIRLLTEVIIVDGAVAWYLWDVHRSVISRLLRLTGVSDLVEPVMTLLEHLVAIIGPAIDIAAVPVIREMCATTNEVTLASLCRVLALLIVPGATTEPRRETEPFPQCLTRMTRMHDVVQRNVSFLLGVPQLVPRLLKLMEVKPQGIRLYQGNRTVTVFIPDQQQQQMHHQQQQIHNNLALLAQQAAAAAGSNSESMSALLQQLYSMMSHAPPAAATPHAPFAETAEEEESDSSSEQSGALPPHEAAAALPSHLPAAAAGGGAPSLPIEAIQQIAETIEQDLPATNSNSCASIGWLTGRPSVKERWRLDSTLVYPSALDRAFLSLESDSVIRGMNEYASARQTQQRDAGTQMIVNAQSEAIFVLNALISGAHYKEVWEKLSECSLLPRCLSIADAVFFENSSTNFAMQATTTNGNGSGNFGSPVEAEEDDASDTESEGSSDTDDFDSDDNHKHDPDTLRKIEYVRLIQEFWNAQDLEECKKIGHDETNSHSRRPLMLRIARQYKTRMEDSCVDSLICHAIECYMRGTPSWLRPPEQNLAFEEVHECLISKMMGSDLDSHNRCNKPLFSRFVEALGNLMAEMLRYNADVLLKLEAALKGAKPAGAADKPFTRLSNGLKMIEALLHGYIFELNLLIRSILLTTSRWVASARSPTNLRGLTPTTGNSSAPLNRGQESPMTTLSRVYHVRLVSAQFVRRLSSGEEVSVSEVYDVLEDGPAKDSLSQRPFRLYGNGMEAPPSTEAASSADRHDLCPHVPPETSALAQIVLGQRAVMMYRIISNNKIERTENTEKVCGITTVMLFFLIEFEEHGEDGIHQLLTELREYQRQRRSAKAAASAFAPSAKSANTAPHHKNDTPTRNNATKATAEPRHKKKPLSENELGYYCVVVNLYRLLCLWVAHYSGQQRFVETLWFSTDIPFNRWNRLVPHILRILPRYFDPPSQA